MTRTHIPHPYAFPRQVIPPRRRVVQQRHRGRIVVSRRNRPTLPPHPLSVAAAAERA